MSSLLGKRIKDRRIELGIKSQRKLADLAGVPLSTLQRIESGQKYSSKWLGVIARALQTTTDYLLTGAVALPSFAAINRSDGLELLSHNPNALPMVPVITWADVKTWSGFTGMKRKYDMVPLLGRSSEKSFALVIVDDSMVSIYPNADSFRPGDIIILDPLKEPVVGSYVVAQSSSDAECTFRQLAEVSGEQVLLALNPTYPVKKRNSFVKIFGVLTGSFRQHN